MLTAVVVAAVAGLVALGGLTGRATVPTAWTATVLAGLPVATLSGAGLATGGWDLRWALAMVAALVLGLLATAVLPDRAAPADPKVAASPWPALTGALLAAVLAGTVVRWGADLVAPLANLSPRAVAAVLVVAAAAAGWGGLGRRGLARTGVILLLVLAGLLVVAGAVTGAPALLADPLVPVSQPPAAWAWLLVVVLIGALGPGVRTVRAGGGSVVPGTVVLGAVTLLVVLALLLYAGGSLLLPSLSLALVAGYVSFAPAVVAAVVVAPVAAVVTVSATVTLHAGLTWLRGLADVEGVPRMWWTRRWFAAVGLGTGALLVALARVPVEWFATVAAVLAVAGWVAGARGGHPRIRWMSRAPSSGRSSDT